MNSTFKEYTREQSSNVARIEHVLDPFSTVDPLLAVDPLLLVTFHNGTTYAYEGVPAETFLDAVNAESIGKFININIKGKFNGVKVEPKAEDQ